MADVIQMDEDFGYDANTAYSPFMGQAEQDELLTREEQASRTMRYGAPAVLAGAVDTFGTSLGLLDDNSVEQALTESMPNLGAYYRNNKEGAQTIGDLVGMFIPGMLGVKVVQRGGAMYNLATRGGRKSRLLESVFTSGKTRDQLLAGVRARDRYLARRFQKDFLKDDVRRQFANRATGTRISDAVKETIAFEAGVYATMSDSQTLYPDEFTTMELIALNVALPSIATAAEVAVMRRMIRASAQSNATSATRNLEEGAIGDVTYRPGQRDAGIAVESYVIRENDRMAQETADSLKLENLNRERLALEESIKKQLKAAGRDKPMKVNTNSVQLSDAQVRALMRTQTSNPNTIFGTMSIEKVPATFDDALALDTNAQKEIKRINKKLDEHYAVAEDKRNVDAIQDLQAAKNQLAGAQYYVVEADGAVARAAERKPVLQPDDLKIRKVPGGENEPVMYSAKIPNDTLYGGRAREIAVTDDGILVIPQPDLKRIGGLKTAGMEAQNNFESLSLYQRSGAYNIINRMVNDYVPGRATFGLTTNDHYTRFDAVLALHGGNGDRFLSDLRLPAEFKNLDDVEFASLAGKYSEYVRLRSINDRSSGSDLIKGVSKRRFTQEDMRKMLNLPGTADGSMHPVMDVFEQFYQQGDTSFAKAVASLDDFRAMMEESAFFPAAARFTGNAVELRGGMIRYAPKDKPTAPSMLVKRPIDMSNTNRELLLDELTADRTLTMAAMQNADQYDAHLVKLVNDVMEEQGPTVQTAKQINTLIEGGQRGRGAFISQEFAAGEMQALRAARSLEEITDRRFRRAVGDLYTQADPAIAPLRESANRADLEMFTAAVHARRQGWDLARDVVDNMDGTFSFKLRKTSANADRWRQRYGDEIPEDALMPAPTALGQAYKPMALTPKALDAYTAISQLGRITLDNTNHIKRLNGQGTVSAKEWWVPPKNFARSTSVFLVDEAGNFVSVVPGRTLKEARAKADQAKAASDKTLITVEDKDLNRYFTLQDQAYERMADFTDVLRQTGRARGSSVTEVVDTGVDVLNDLMESLNKQFESILRRSRAVYFEPEIGYAKKLYNASGSESAPLGQSVWQNYLAAIFGNPTINPNDNIGKVYNAIESVYDDVLGTLYDRIGMSVQAANFRPSMSTKRDKEIFNTLNKQLGEHNPYSSTMDYLQRTHALKPPANMRKHMAKLNHITSLLTLRLFEVGHALLTLTSLGATLPGVIKAMRRTPLESSEQHAARIGAYGIKLDEDNAMFSPVRAATSTMHFIFTKEGRRVWQAAAKEGYFDQSVAEIMRTLTAPSQGYVERLVGKYGKFTTILSDKSEELARGIAFMHGYQIAKQGLGIRDDKLAFAFAHRTANETIGNYSPHNRPRIFQGAVGMPLGLFQTFIWNYYQRVFSYVENRQLKALGWQYFSQAAVFGAQTVPGFQQFVDVFASNYDGTANPVEALERRFGTETAEWILYGSLSNLPKLFGADDGIALYTRGDVTLRNIPTVVTPQETPVAAMLTRSFGALGKTIDMFKERGFSAQQLSEIIANYSTNRFMRNIGHMYSGYVTDRRGQVVGTTPSFGDIIDGEVENEMALISRLAGMRTLKESRKVEAHARIRDTQFSQRSLMERLRDGIRADARSGHVSQARLNEAFANYIRYGGNPENIGSWIAQQMLKGQVDKSMLELMKVINDPTRSYDIQRLISGMVLPENDPEFAE